MSLEQQHELRLQIRRLKRINNRLRIQRKKNERHIHKLGTLLDKMKSEDARRNGYDTPYKENSNE